LTHALEALVEAVFSPSKGIAAGADACEAETAVLSLCPDVGLPVGDIDEFGRIVPGTFTEPGSSPTTGFVVSVEVEAC